ncbi:hypothetical protein KFE25_000854 [Diacronema lutheri]|uniref:SHOCT domain-containing protein n=1 Tax=Diacronema lutheri TaxID=2081491 RepID=A0A8J5XHN8_DIALT|nr:hypothetical protein KFE25_000854 [Diacronema lutheri]
MNLELSGRAANEPIASPRSRPSSRPEAALAKGAGHELIAPKKTKKSIMLSPRSRAYVPDEADLAPPAPAPAPKGVLEPMAVAAPVLEPAPATAPARPRAPPQLASAPTAEDAPPRPIDVAKPEARESEEKETTPKEQQHPKLKQEKNKLNRQPSRGLPFTSPNSARGPGSARGPAPPPAGPPAQPATLSSRASPRASARNGSTSARGSPALHGMTLVQLCELKQKGMFSDAEFTALKQQLLADL